MKDFGVIFDMDGVIVDNYKFHIQAWVEFGKKNGMNITDDDIYQVFGNTNKEIFKLFFDSKFNEEEVKKYSEEKELLYRQLFSNSIKAADGLPELVKSLKEMNIKMAVATGGPKENVNFVMEKTGLRSYFEHIVDDSHVTRGKPNPDIFLLAAELLKKKPSDCIVFEDSVHGIEAAIAANMKVIALTTTYKRDKLGRANYIIQNFKDINAESLYQIWVENPLK